MPDNPRQKVDYQGQDDPFDDMPVNMTERSAPHEIVREFISEEGIEGKTNLTRRQIKAFTVLEIVDGDFPELGLARLKKFLHYVISEKGDSRKGLLTMLGRSGMMEEQQQEQQGMKRSNY